LPARFKCGVKIGGKRVRRARKVTERKMSDKHLLEAWEAILKYDENGRKKMEKGEKRD
jgi:hypothetical protein